MTPQHSYRLHCSSCGNRYADHFSAGFLLTCPEAHAPSLLRARYESTSFAVQPELPGIFRFAQWLPVQRILPNAPGPVVFHSQAFGPRFGFQQLWFAFSGYWPEKGAFMTTCTFKELEAPVVCARIPEGITERLVVASAGNTARAFMRVCSECATPLVVIVPKSALSALWLTRPKADCVTVVAVTGDADYADAIHVSRLLSQETGFFPEGGVSNIARRDGLGTVLLTMVEATGCLPQHYVQAIGSGTGGIAVWEAGLRLREDGRFGKHRPRLHLSQNAPFTPMVDAWQRLSPTLPQTDEAEQKACLRQVRAQVLANRQPPYALTGGVYDALRESQGYMYAVSNAEAEQTGQIFLETEGCDLDPAAEVALASLIQAIKMGRIGPDESVLVNLTGGGYRRLKQEHAVQGIVPDITVSYTEYSHAPATVVADLCRRINSSKLS